VFHAKAPTNGAGIAFSIGLTLAGMELGRSRLKKPRTGRRAPRNSRCRQGMHIHSCENCEILGQYVWPTVSAAFMKANH